MKYFKLLLILALLSGCATTANFQKYHDSTIGKDISAVIRLWGYPQSETTSPNGNKVYVFSKSQAINKSGSTIVTVIDNTAYASTTPPSTVTHSCTVWVEVNQNNRVLTWSASGNACMLSSEWVESIDPVTVKTEVSDNQQLDVVETTRPDVGNVRNDNRQLSIGEIVFPIFEPMGLYNSPTIESERVEKLTKNSRLTINENKNGWLRVTTMGGTKGWVMILWVSR